MILFKSEIKKFGREALRSWNSEQNIKFPDKWRSYILLAVEKDLGLGYGLNLNYLNITSEQWLDLLKP